jgi:hypothetical protein
MRILKKIYDLKTLFIFFVAAVIITVLTFLTVGPRNEARRPSQFIGSQSSVDDIKEFKRQVISSLQIQSVSADDTAVSMLLPAEICQHYKQFELTVEAEGLAVDGNPVRMTVSKDCLDLNAQTLRLIWHVRPRDLPPAMDIPVKTWNIKALTFIPQSEEQPIRITGYEFIFVLGSPAAIEFK